MVSTKFKTWIGAWWTGEHQMEGEELEHTRRALKEAHQAFWEPGEPVFDKNMKLYSPTGTQGAKYRLPKQLKKLAAHRMVCAISGVAVAAWLANSFR